MKNIKIRIIDENGGIDFISVPEKEVDEVCEDFHRRFTYVEITTQKDGITISRQHEKKEEPKNDPK